MTQSRIAIRWTVNVDRLERARVSNAWTRRRLATAARVDPKTITDMCSGRRRPNFATLTAVCTALGLTVADVIVFDVAVTGASTAREGGPPQEK